MSADEMGTRRRPVRGLPQPDGEKRTGPTERAGPAPVAEPTPTSRAEAVREAPQGVERSEGRVVPAASSERDPRTFRVYRELYGELTRLVRELEDLGLQSNRTELLHALLFYELPGSGESAEKMVRRWRKAQAGA